jgi:hypothetical protein
VTAALAPEAIMLAGRLGVILRSFVVERATKDLSVGPKALCQK